MEKDVECCLCHEIFTKCDSIWDGRTWQCKACYMRLVEKEAAQLTVITKERDKLKDDIRCERELFADVTNKLKAQCDELKNKLHEIAEIYIQRESGLPETAPEAYLLQELKEIYSIAKGMTEPSLIKAQCDRYRSEEIEIGLALQSVHDELTNSAWSEAHGNEGHLLRKFRSMKNGILIKTMEKASQALKEADNKDKGGKA
jgi:hypothetical protein